MMRRLFTIVSGLSLPLCVGLVVLFGGVRDDDRDHACGVLAE